MEELGPQDIEDLLRELEEESGAQESLPPDVEELLGDLQSSSRHLDRADAAEQLGKVGASSPQIIRALITAYESDPSMMVNSAAAKSLRAPVHQQCLQEHPGLMEATERAFQQRPGADRQQPRSGSSLEPPELEAALKSVGDIGDPVGLVALAAGVIAWAVGVLAGSWIVVGDPQWALSGIFSMMDHGETDADLGFCCTLPVLGLVLLALLPMLGLRSAKRIPHSDAKAIVIIGAIIAFVGGCLSAMVGAAISWFLALL